MSYKREEPCDGAVKPDQKILENLEVYTFGQPRVGDQKLAEFGDKALQGRHYGVVYNKGSVPRVPPDDDEYQYKHFGTCRYYQDGEPREARTYVNSLFSSLSNFPTIFNNLEITLQV